MFVDDEDGLIAGGRRVAAFRLVRAAKIALLPVFLQIVIIAHDVTQVPKPPFLHPIIAVLNRRLPYALVQIADTQSGISWPEAVMASSDSQDSSRPNARRYQCA